MNDRYFAREVLPWRGKRRWKVYERHPSIPNVSGSRYVCPDQSSADALASRLNLAQT